MKKCILRLSNICCLALFVLLSGPLGRNLHAQSPCSKNQIWSVFVGSHELGDVNDQMLTEQVTAEKDGKQTFSRRWAGGSSSRSVSIILTIYKTDQAARDAVENYGKGGSGIVPISPRIGDAGYWTNTLVRPYYLICRKNVTISFFSRYARSGNVGPQDSYLKLMVERLDQLGCAPTVSSPATEHKIVIYNPVQCSPNPAKAGDTVTCSVNASDTQGHALSYAWSCSGGAFTGQPGGSTGIWSAPPNKTPQIAEYDITATISGQEGLSVQSTSKQMVSPDDRVIQITRAPRGDPNPVESGKTVTCDVQAVHPDGLPLFYTWTAGQGIFIQSDSKNAQWVWRAPENATAKIMDCPLEVVVTSSDGLKSKGSYIQKVLGRNMLDLFILNKNELEGKSFLTGQKITIHGKLTCAGKSVSRADIAMVIKPPSISPIQHAGAVTRGDGSFSITYDVPRIRASQMPKPEEWVVTLTATPFEKEMGTTTADVRIRIVPVFFQLKSVRLVQVIETPLIDGKRYLAADKGAALRVYLACPNLVGIEEKDFPEITIDLDIGYGNTDILKKPFTFKLKKRPGFPVSHSLKPFDLMIPPLKAHPEGPLLIGALVDPAFTYTDPRDSEGMFQGISAHVKDMKHLFLRFIPVGIPTGQGKGFWDNEELKRFLTFCEEQAEFIRQTYPLPASHIHIRKARTTYNPWKTAFKPFPKSTFGKNPRITALLSRLGLESMLEGRTLVGVLPNDDFWFESPAVSGSATGWIPAAVIRYEPTISNKGYFEPDGLTAHEVGHVQKLNMGTEEYASHPEPNAVILDDGKQARFGGKKINGLILKNGNVYDLNDAGEFARAFNYPVDKDHVLCFMGAVPNRGEDIRRFYGQWVCPETYTALFRALMDPPGEPMLYVSGVIRADGSITLAHIYEIRKEPGGQYHGDYSVACLSATGKTLSEAFFSAHSGRDQVFGVTLPAPPDVAEVVVKYRGSVKAQKKRSPNRPEVKLLSPNGGETIKSSMHVRWQASDADHEPLKYSILYSNDNGNTWSTLAAELNENTYDMPIEALPQGGECLVKIIASDGFNTREDISDRPFSLIAGTSQKDPKDSKSIEKPRINLRCLTPNPIAGRPVAFSATIISDQDSQTTLEYQWFLDGQPVAWAGFSPQWQNSKRGVHHVGIMVFDGKEKVGKILAFTVSAAAGKPTPPVGSILGRVLLLDTIPPLYQNRKNVFFPSDTAYVWMESKVSKTPHKLEIIWAGPFGKEAKREEFDLRGWGTVETFWSSLYMQNNSEGRWNINLLVDGRIERTLSFTVRARD